MPLNPRTSRRTLITGAAAATATLTIPGAGTARAAGPAAQPTVDPRQLICGLTGAGSGIFYAVGSDGVLQWYRNLGWQTGEPTWSNAGYARNIGTGWQAFVTVMGNSDGSLYALTGAGDIRRYRYVLTNATTGAGYWQNGTGTLIGTGFNRFARVFGGPDGVVWCTDDDGVLYRCVVGAYGMSNPVAVGSGFKDCSWVGADFGGVVYGIYHGVLTWWRRAGSWWQNNGMGIAIGDDGWGTLTHNVMCAAGTGLFYYIASSTGAAPQDDNRLCWMRLVNYQTVAATGGPRWGNGGNNRVVGVGLTAQRWAPLQGYADPVSVTPGQPVGLAASTTFGTVTASVLRFAPGTGEPAVVIPAQQITGRLQPLPATYRSAGCGWENLLTVRVGVDWPSGVYAIRMVGPRGLTRDVPFVVRPTAPANLLAVLLPTCTYNAYNAWGGHSAYTALSVPAPSTFSLRRPSYTMTTTSGGVLNGELFSDLALLKWLSSNGFSYDCYTDQDLQENTAWPLRYRALLLTTHPEYFTLDMRQAVADFVASGGRLLYAGGNGIYEPCSFSGDRTAVTYREPDGDRHPYGTLGLPESQILGVNYTADGWMTFAPYRVAHTSPVLAGTGLSVGDQFARAGFNNAGSGWEFDIADGRDGSAQPAEIVAVGQNPASVGANMVYLRNRGANGGSVFSASSMSFVGALTYDARLSRLFRNAVTDAIAVNPARAGARVRAPRRYVTPSRRVPFENAHP